LKGDIKKFFASIDHKILENILVKHISDEKALWLLSQVIDSFSSNPLLIYPLERGRGSGLPLGNLTSQLLVNIYINEFDQFVKRDLKIKYYIRYADDFVILSESKKYLEQLIPKISGFLEIQLKLSLHPNKVFIKTNNSGVDFLGWVNFPKYRVLRTSTKRRMFKKIKQTSKQETVVSYLGLLSHGNGHKLTDKISSIYLKNKNF
jgi:retron-type reverse transcriptase